ncbi:MAG: excinuclease ABC subunit UvrC [Beutenbergiaceae bacterium]
MADPASYRPKPGEIPTQPGVYRFRDSHRRVIYVGKAISLRSRLSSYFTGPGTLHPRTQQMVTSAASVDWTVVANEGEALALEYAWIKEFEPRFNVKYRDDKSYPYLAITMGEEFPRVQVMRGRKRPGTRYFGPYAHAWAIRESVDLLLRVFPIRSCSAGVFKRAGQTGRPCLLGYIDKCSAPCVGNIDVDAHRALAQDFASFMAGDASPYIKRLETQMQAASAAQEYEQAARLRDDLGALRKVLDRNAVVLPERTDADLFAMATDELEASVQVFHIRGGRVRGQRGWVTERVEDLSDGDLVERLLTQVYGEAEPDPGLIPREIIVPALPADVAQLQQWLESLRGSRVRVRVAQRGDMRALAQTVQRNAEQALALHKTRRAGDLSARSLALSQLQEFLGMPESPLRIECFDISHTQGSQQVASMVVFEDGLPRKSDYRHFVIRGNGDGDGARDDTEAMAEVVTRRFRRYLEQAQQTGQEGSRQRFAYPPNLVVVDGAGPQVAAAQRALTDLGIVDLMVVGLAKRLEEVWLPGEEFPLVLPRSSEGLYLLQRVRDEAHRFAITHHRKRRGKAMTRSELDAIDGLGPARQAALLKVFGSVRTLRGASLEDIAAVPGIGPKLAQHVQQVLRGAAQAPAESDAALRDTPSS